MRHSKIDLTMNVYTDPALLDVRGVLDAPPAPPLLTTAGPESGREAVRATGTDDSLARVVAPMVAPTLDNASTELSLPVKNGKRRKCGSGARRTRRNFKPCQTKDPRTIPVSGLRHWALQDLNL